jgi:hypothetical protein
MAVSRTLSEARALVAADSATLLSFCLLGGPSTRASDLEPLSQPRIAAFTDDPLPSSKHQERAELSDGLLAQSPPLSTVEQRKETILAGFPLATPESVEEAVAKQYGLEIVRRLTIESLNQRLVVLRLPDSRAVADVVAALKADPRISSAQINARYALPEPQPSGPPRISDDKQDAHAKGEKRQASSPSRKTAPPARAAAKPEDRPKAAQVTRAAGPIATMNTRQQRSLVTGNHAALHFPTADEPFVNVGMRNK